MNELLNIVIPKIKAYWKDVAYSMKYETYEVDAIETESHNLKECCVKLFTDWLTTSHIMLLLLRLGKHFLNASNKLMS